MGLITEDSKVLDTNILIYHLNDCLEDDAEQFLEKAFESNSYISVITRIELLGWFKHTEKSLSRAEELLNILNEQPLNEEVVKWCIQLRQKTKLKVPDAIIAATALHLKRPLMTRNIKDFQKVPHLQLFNPFESEKMNSLQKDVWKRLMSEILLDASALLALVKQETGAEHVMAEIEHAAINIINLTEVVTKLFDAGLSTEAACLINKNEV